MPTVLLYSECTQDIGGTQCSKPRVYCRERADLTDSLRQLDRELVTIKKDLRTAHQKSTTLIALKRTAEVSHTHLTM